jgi:hypothetical protein
LFGVLNIKFLWFGLLLVFPLATAWALHDGSGSGNHAPAAQIQAPATPSPGGENLTKIPVEVVAKGGKTDWVYVEMPNQTIPEPGTDALLALTSLLLLRRHRGK